MNEVWAVHYDGKFMNQKHGNRMGAVYNTKGKAQSCVTRLAKQWATWPSRTFTDPTKLAVVRYVPEAA